MEKRLAIIANDRGVPGVKIDIAKYKAFFRSSYGGGWSDSEITTMLNVSRTRLRSKIAEYKLLDLDYLIVVFSGHGGQERETILEINAQEETILESELHDIAVRQLNIYDCCRCYSEVLTESVKNRLETKLFSTINVRAKYEQRIMQAIPQIVRLYACSVGEKAYDLGEGGIYSKHLLENAIQMQSQYKYVGDAHVEAKQQTTEEEPKQHPDSVIPRCLTKQQLIIAINPYT